MNSHQQISSVQTANFQCHSRSIIKCVWSIQLPKHSLQFLYNKIPLCYETGLTFQATIMVALQKGKAMKAAVTRMLNEDAFATVLGYDAACIGFLNSDPTMIVPDESNEYSKHIY